MKNIILKSTLIFFTVFLLSQCKKDSVVFLEPGLYTSYDMVRIVHPGHSDPATFNSYIRDVEIREDDSIANHYYIENLVGCDTAYIRMDSKQVVVISITDNCGYWLSGFPKFQSLSTDTLTYDEMHQWSGGARTLTGTLVKKQ